MTKLSVVLATRNEETNIGDCLASVKNLADEIIVLDEHSTDKTREIAKKHGAKVFEVDHEEIFHVTKQKALEKATGDWILQLDADERVTDELASEIKEVLNMDSHQIGKRLLSRKKERLFRRHRAVIEKRDGKVGADSEDVVAFFVPRINYFLGKPLIHAGVYPDGVIRLVKRGFAHFPAKSVHEQIEVKGRVEWLFNDLEHHDSPTLKRYFSRLNRYTDLHSEELKKSRASKNILYFVYYCFFKSAFAFLKLYFLHKGFLDGARGFLWSFFSASHFPIAYFKYITNG